MAKKETELEPKVAEPRAAEPKAAEAKTRDASKASAPAPKIGTVKERRAARQAAKAAAAVNKVTKGEI